MAGFDVTEIDETDPPLLINHHVESNNTTDGPDDFHLFVVKRIIIDDTVGGFAVFQDVRSMEPQNGVRVGHAGGDDLAAAGIAGHEMRFHQAGYHFQIRFDKSPIDPDRNTLRGFSEIQMGISVRLRGIPSQP
jgi:hypothetical protein